MEGKKDFGEKLEEFFAGKGFYIVLLLCAVLIGTSIWLMANGSRADVETGTGGEAAVTVAQAPAAEEKERETVPFLMKYLRCKY